LSGRVKVKVGVKKKMASRFEPLAINISKLISAGEEGLLGKREKALF
jgi:hypothetical protein